MALFGKQASDKQPAAKKPSKKAAATKRESKVASISDVNAATSSVQEEPTTPQRVSTNQDTVPALTGSKNDAYNGFSTGVYSEEAAAKRKSANGSEVVDQYAIQHEVGVVYINEDGREFYFDEYGSPQFADEVPPSPDIPESFEDARHSSSRERFQLEAERARNVSAANIAQNFDSVVDGDSGYSGNGGGNGGGYPAPSEQRPYAQSYAPTGAGEHRQDGSQQDYGYTDSTPPASGYTPRHTERGTLKLENIDHGDSPLINLTSAEHVDNPFLEGSKEINDQIDQGVVAENFPIIATTIASLVHSSKSPDEITRTLLGYIQTTLAGEGTDATLKLLGTENIYSPLLVSALLYNISQKPIEPVALREIWDVRPEVRVEEKIVYVKERSNAAPVDGERGYWISMEGVEDNATNPVYDTLAAEFEAAPKAPLKLNYSHLDY